MGDMADDAATLPGSGPETGDSAALQQGPWRKHFALSSGLSAPIDAAEQFLREAGFDRAPWLAVGFAGGIWAWFALDDSRHWLGLVGICIFTALVALLLMRGDGRYPFLRVALAAMATMIAACCAMRSHCTNDIVSCCTQAMTFASTWMTTLRSRTGCIQETETKQLLLMSNYRLRPGWWCHDGEFPGSILTVLTR